MKRLKTQCRNNHLLAIIDHGLCVRNNIHILFIRNFLWFCLANTLIMVHITCNTLCTIKYIQTTKLAPVGNLFTKTLFLSCGHFFRFYINIWRCFVLEPINLFWEIFADPCPHLCYVIKKLLIDYLMYTFFI